MNEQELADLHALWKEELKPYSAKIPPEVKEEIRAFCKFARKPENGEIAYPDLEEIVQKKFGVRVNIRTLGDWVKDRY